MMARRASTTGVREAGIDPAPERSSSTWADLPRSQADALLACDYLETVTVSGTRMSVLAVIEHATRRIRIVGATAHPTASSVSGTGRAGGRTQAGVRPRGLRCPPRPSNAASTASNDTAPSPARYDELAVRHDATVIIAANGYDQDPPSKRH
jgi:hypothetical protein